MEDCRIALTHPEIDQFFDDVINREDNTKCKNFYFLKELPACIHRTTQNKKLTHGVGSVVVSKKDVNLDGYIEANTQNLLKYTAENNFEQPIETKSVNLLLTRKSYEQKEKVLGMLAAIGFEGLIEKMKDVYIGVDKARFDDYVKTLVESDNGLVIVSENPDCSSIGFNSQETVAAVTPIAGRPMQKLTPEEIKLNSESWQKAYKAFGAQAIDKEDVPFGSAVNPETAKLDTSQEEEIWL